jgi:hypothetical protein
MPFSTGRLWIDGEAKPLRFSKPRRWGVKYLTKNYNYFTPFSIFLNNKFDRYGRQQFGLER